MIHKITEVLDIEDDGSSGAGLAAQSKSAAAYTLTSVDLTKYEGGGCYLIDAGSISGGATVDFKIQDSADNSSFADVSGLAITQITASGKAFLNFRVRQVRRYIQGILTVGTASTVVCVIFIGQKRVVSN